ncbi:MAG TPA: hypothetical protein PKH07_12105, partial [bacterium]|nr:hypothetical protein [bacterium]
VSGGLFQGITSGNDGRMISLPSLGLTASDWNFVEVRMKVTAGSVVDLFFRSAGDSSFTLGKRIRFDITNTDEFVTYRADTRLVGSWVGDIAQIRFDPSNVSGAQVQVDCIRLLR